MTQTKQEITAQVKREMIHGRANRSTVETISFDEWRKGLRVNKDVPQEMWTPVTAVCRRSPARDTGSSLRGQDEEIRAYAERELLWIHEVLIDDGVSGSKIRENYERAISNLRTGKTTGLVVWKFDRFSRIGTEAAGEVVKALRIRREAGSPAIFIAVGDRLDSRTKSADRAEAQYEAEKFETELNTRATDARRYAQEISSKLLPANARHRRSAKRVGVGMRPFGYTNIPLTHEDGTSDGMTRIPDAYEAKIVREVADRLASGESPYSVATWLNNSGVPTAKSAARRARQDGKPWEDLNYGVWSHVVVRNMWTSDILLGFATYQGRVLTDEDGMPWRKWEPLVDDQTMEQVRARVTHRKHYASNYAPMKDRPEPNRRASRLLSWMIVCATCGVRLHAGTSGGKHIYRSRCASPDCRNSISVGALAVEEYVIADWLEIVGPRRMVITKTISDSISQEVSLSSYRHALKLAMEEMMHDNVDMDEVYTRVREIKAKIASLESSASARVTVTEKSDYTYAEMWEKATTLEARRAILLQTIDSVRVSGASVRGPYGKVRDRVRIVYSA